MAFRVIRMAIVGLLAALSFDGSCHLASDYWRAVFVTPDAQWQFASIMAPLVIGLGAAAGLVATFPRPSLPRIFLFGAWVITIFPTILALLVLMHAY
jgi:hypothetical protein